MSFQDIAKRLPADQMAVAGPGPEARPGAGRRTAGPGPRSPGLWSAPA